MVEKREHKQRDKEVGRRGPKWAFMERFTVYGLETGEPYLKRLRVISTPWFGIFLHHILSSDPGIDPHNHPWDFVSLILRGGYEEHNYTSHTTMLGGYKVHWNIWIKERRPGRFHFRRANDRHMVVLEEGKTAWTLVLHFRRKNEWGFWTLPDRFVKSEDYFNGER